MPVKWQDLVAGGAGAIDEALFGIPEWALKKINREAVEKYIAANKKAYNIGEGIGTVGSMFIPIPGLGAAGAVGKAAKAAKGLDTVTDLARVADKGVDLYRGAATLAGGAGDIKKGIDFAKLGKMAKVGAASGAIEGGVRGITSEKTPEQILNDIKTGALFGAGGGVVGGALADNLPRWLGEASKNTQKAYLGTTDLGRRQALAYLKDVAGPGAKGIGKFKAADAGRKELVRVGREIGAHIPGKMDDAIIKHSATWGALDDIMEKAAPNVRGSDLYAQAMEKLNVPELYKEFGEKEVNEFLKQIMAEGSNRSGLANIRAHLGDWLKASYNPSTIKSGKDAATQRMTKSIAGALRSGVDEIVMDTADKAGANIDFGKLKKDYLPMRAIAESAAIQDITPARFSMGSQTAEKLAASSLLGATGYATGGEDTDIKDKLARAALGATAGALGSKALGGLVTRGLSGANPVIEAAERGIGKIAPDIISRMGSQAGGEAASMFARTAVSQVPTETARESEAAAAGATAGTGDEKAYMSRITDSLRSYAVANGVQEDSPEYQKFVRDVYMLTDGFAPDKIAPVLYRDPAEQAAYTKALAVSRQLSDVMPRATKSAPGVLGFGGDEVEKLQRNAAIDQLAAIVGDVAKDRGSEKAAKKALDSILSGREDSSRKAELVKILLAQYGIDLDEITSLGVV